MPPEGPVEATPVGESAGRREAASPVPAPPALNPAPAPTTPPRRGELVVAAAGSGVVAGLLGTSLHGHLWFPGGSDFAFPLGAVLALLLVAAVCFFISAWSRNVWAGVWSGAAAYLTAGLLSLHIGGSGLIFANMQGQLWLYGIAVCTLLVPFAARGTAAPRRR